MVLRNGREDGLLNRETILSLVSVGYVSILVGLLYSITTQSWNVFSALVFIGALLAIPFIFLT
ncbi:hypothetical protein [Halorubrum salipaludis]|uniref:hypothetical protein n=1 Tax=Halorubrum salipaludis TaxID=2032630 RepID=UPI0011819DBB|nr:hypothetical protein [Halorubrum salipaludis]